MCVLILKPALESLHVCSFHKQHVDPPVFTACVFFPQTTYGSTSGHCMCVLSTNHLWINQWSLHVCYFPQTTYGSTRVIACVFFSQTTHGSTTVIVCVFFPQTTHGSTSGHCMCVLFHKPHMDQPVVIACVFFSQTTCGPTRLIACVFLY